MGGPRTTYNNSVLLSVSVEMAQLDQFDLLNLLLEANDVRDPGQVCHKLHEHGVTTITEFAELSVETLYKWKITNYFVHRALPQAQALLVASSDDLAAIRQQLLVRARVQYMYVCTI